MTGYVHISKREEAAAAAATEHPAQRIPAQVAQRIARLEATLRKQYAIASEARASRDEAQRLAEAAAAVNRQLQIALDTVRAEGHWLRTELRDARDANTALLADIADLSRQVTDLKATQGAQGDVEAIITIRGTDLTTKRVDALAVHRALQAAGDSVLYHLHETAQKAGAAQRPHLKAVTA